MLNKDDIKQIITDTVLGFDINVLADDQDFTEVGIDSLDLMTILLALDEKHGIKIPDEMFDQCGSINKILQQVNK